MNQAQVVSDKMQHPLIDTSKYMLEIGDYSNYDRALILFNHMSFSYLPDDYLERIYEDKFYWKIIKHPNYNPRLIEFVTDQNNASNVSPEDYTAFILEKLDNP